MDWNADKQRELEAFLTRFTSPDPAAQQLNLQQLAALAHEAGALQALLGLLTRPATAAASPVYTVAQRTAAATTARQLLRVNPSFLTVIDLGAAGTDLFAALLAEPVRIGQTSLCSLMAALARAEAVAAPATPVFLSTLLACVSQTASAALANFAAVTGEPPAQLLASELTHVRAALRVVRILAEDNAAVLPAAATAQTRDALCTTFTAALAVLSCLSKAAESSSSSSSPRSPPSVDDPLLTLSVQMLESLTACVSAELITFSADPVAAGGVTEASVWHGTLTALSVVVLPQVSVCLSIDFPTFLYVAATWLQPVWAFTSACASAAALSADALAPLLSLTVPAVQSFWEACCAVQAAQKDGDDLEDDDTVADAILGAIACVADVVTHVGVDVALLPSMAPHVHGLAQLPGPLAESLMRSNECDQSHADDPSAVLAVLQRSHAKRHGRTDKVNDGGGEGGEGGVLSETRSADGKAESVTNSDGDGEQEGAWSGFDVLLPDGGARRQSLSWLLNCLAFACPASSLTATVIAPMVDLICTTDLTPSDGSDVSLAAAVRVEAALFVLSEVTEEVLAGWDGTVGPAQRRAEDWVFLTEVSRLATHVMALLNRFLASPPSVAASSCASGVPFFLRIACCRWLARLLSGAEQAVLNAAASSPAAAAPVWDALASMGGVPQLLEALRLLASAESSKAAQQECLHAIDIVLTGALRRSPRDIVARGTGGGGGTEAYEDDSDSDDEILDDDDDEDGQRGTASLAFQLGLLSTSSTSPSPLFGFLCTLTQGLLAGERPCAALPARLDLYSLLSRVLSCLETSLALPGGAACITTLLEAVAQRYMSLQSLASTAASHGSCAHAELVVIESVSILNCLCDVGASVGPLLAPACTWLVQVCGSVLLDEWRGTRAEVYQQSVVTNAADRCMLALDLLSCACDALLDRDALTCLATPTTQASRPGHASGAVTALTSLRAAFAVSQDGHTLLSLTVGVVRQALARKPVVHVVTAAGAEAEEDLHNDTEADLRRAAFGVLYDLVFLFSTDSHDGHGDSHPARALTMAPATESHVTVCASLVDLCLGELDGLVRVAERGQSVVSYVANGAALSNAMLCLGETLFFLAAGTAAEDAAKAAVVVPVLAPLLQPCQRLLMALITLLADRGLFAVPVSVSQNAASAVTALACTLQVLARHGHPSAQLSSEVQCRMIRAVSPQAKHFKPTRAHEGAFECTQLLVCLGEALTLQSDEALAATVMSTGVAAPFGACLTLVLDGISGGGGEKASGSQRVLHAWQRVMQSVARSPVQWGKALSMAKQQKLRRLFPSS